MANELVLIKESDLQVTLQSKQDKIIAILGNGDAKKGMLLYEKELSFAIQACNSNTQLQQADKGSIAKCIWNTAITGLSLNPVMKMAYITPRKVNNQIQAILMPSYIGLAKLATDTGSVMKLSAYVVYKNDEFEVEYGTETKIIHKPKFGKHTNADITGAYAIGLLKDGSKQFEYMDIAEIEGIRARSDSYRAFESGRANSCIWDSDMPEMCKKTVIKRLCKYLPHSERNEKWEKVMDAIDIDNKDYTAGVNMIEYARMLLNNSTYDATQRQYIEGQIDNDCSAGDCEKIIDDLKLNQLEPVKQTSFNNANDINDAVKLTISKDEGTTLFAPEQ